jgi:invasion protein IalB
MLHKFLGAFAAVAVLSAGLCTVSSDANAAGTQDQQVKLLYSQWTKLCVDDGKRDLHGCMTAKEGRTESGDPVISAVIVDDPAKPVIRVKFPLGMQIVHGTRLIVDNNTPIVQSYVGCVENGCVADYDLTPTLRAQLKRGTNLVLQAINANGAPLTLPIPLDGLGAAMNGAAKDPAAVTRNRDEIKGQKPPSVYLADPRTSLLAAQTTSGNEPIPTLIYVDWTKFCLKGKEENAKQVCFTGKDGRIESGQPVVAAVLIEPEAEAKKIFRVTLPLGMRLEHGTRLIVDDQAPLQAPFVICFKNGCMSDYEATPELINKLKTGHRLAVQAFNSDGGVLTLELPLRPGDGASFAEAQQGPPTDPKVFEEKQRKLEAELQERADKAKARLTSSPPANPVVAVAPPAEKPSASPLAVAPPGRRVALVIGNSAYQNVPMLPNPSRDADRVGDALRAVGFQSVTVVNNLTHDKMLDALRSFAVQASHADWAVVYYAGHGMEVAGTNYLIPVDAVLKTDRDVSLEAIPLDQVLNVVDRASGLRLVMLDACRDNPFANQMKRTLAMASRSVSRGLASVEPDAGTLVVYAAKDGETAMDGDGGDSPFATAFMQNLKTPNLEIRRLFDDVRDDVMAATQRQQQPFSYGSLSGHHDYYFLTSK